MGTIPADKEYAAQAMAAHSQRLFEINATLSPDPTPM